MTILSRRQRTLNAANRRSQGLLLPLKLLKFEICGGLAFLEPLHRLPVLHVHQMLLIFSHRSGDLHRAYRQRLQLMSGIDFCLKESFINCALQNYHWHHQKIRTQAKSCKQPLPEYIVAVCNVFNIFRCLWVDIITENNLNYHNLGTKTKTGSQIIASNKVAESDNVTSLVPEIYFELLESLTSV